MYPVACLGVTWAIGRDHDRDRRIFLCGVVLVAAFVVIAGWWYLRNLRLFDDPTAASQVAEATGLRSGAIDWIGELRGLYYSFWGMFGWFNVPAPESFYCWTALVLLVAVCGLIVVFVRYRRSIASDDWAIFGLLSFYGVLVIGAWAQFNTLTLAGQGRLCFPLLGALGCAVAYGLWSFRSRTAIVLLLAPLAVAAVSFPFTLIEPAYATTAQIRVDDWSPPNDAVNVLFREPWNDNACARLWITPPEWDIVTSQASVELAFEGLCDISGYWSVFLHFSDLQQETCITGDTSHIVSQVDTMPDGGHTPFPALKTGYVLEDRLTLAIPDGIDFNRDWHLQLGLYDAGGTFIRAFVTPEDGGESLNEADWAFVGKCSPELVNLALRRTPES
jgi:hypothetical protein